MVARIYRGTTLLGISVLIALTLVSCGGGAPTDAQSGSATQPLIPECFEQTNGQDDQMELTDSVFTIAGTDGPSAYTTFAVEVANTSTTDALILGEFTTRFLDKSGDEIEESKGQILKEPGWVQFLAPGDSAWFGGRTIIPTDPAAESISIESTRSFRLPDDQVEYPPTLGTSDVSYAPDDQGGQLEFLAHNDTDTTFEHVSAQLLMRDSDGNIVGGDNRYRDTNDPMFTVTPGDNELTYPQAFGEDPPDTADMDQTEIILNNTPSFKDLDPDCEEVIGLGRFNY